jgi:hypothetical protein
MATSTLESKKQSRLWFDPLGRTMLSAFNGAIGTTNSAIEGTANALQGLSDTTAGVQKNTAAWFRKYEPYLTDTQKALSDVGAGVDKISTSIDTGLDRILSTIQKSLTGWSSHSGAVVMSLNGVAANPLDFNSVGNNLKSLLNGINPGFGDSINTNLQKLNLDKLAKAPEMLFNSVGRLARAIDNILSIPLSFISSIYFGVIDIIKRIGKALNNIINNFFEFLFNFLDTILPLTEIMTLLQTVGKLAGQIQGIAAIFGGVNIVSGFALQINTFTTQVNGILSNPRDFVFGMLPVDITNGISQVLYNLDNPQNFINQFVPPELTGIFSKISQVTGYGFNGNMGYGIETILKASQQGLVTGFLQSFANQYNVLAPLLGGTAPVPAPETLGGPPSLINGYNAGLNNRNVVRQPQYADNNSPTSTSTTPTPETAGMPSRAAIITGGNSGTSNYKLQVGDFEAYVVDKDGQVMRAASQAEINAGKIIDPV